MTSNNVVLLTGVNGHLASGIALRLVEHGYRVRGTVRSLARGDFVKQELANRGYEHALEIVEVPDITVDGVFDSAMEGSCELTRTGRMVTQA